MDNHTLLEIIQMAIKLSKLEQHPVGSLWATMSDDDPAVVFGGGWKKLGECRVLQCADDDHPAGTTEEAGLPDIQGYLNDSYGESGCFWSVGGAFTARRTGIRYNRTYDNNTSQMDLDFKASSYNPIYGKSDTVQMKSIYANIWQRVS